MTRARRSSYLVDELGRPLSSAERAIAAQRWLRAPDLDRRIAHGDDSAGDAWLDVRTGAVRYVAVGQRPEDDPAESDLAARVARHCGRGS